MNAAAEFEAFLFPYEDLMTGENLMGKADSMYFL
jgi:hypothetical protein